MAVPGLLIEYLISGAVAMIWLYPMLEDKLESVGPAFVPLIALGLYVIGMVIDFSAWVATRAIKHRIRRGVNKKYGMDPPSTSGSGTARQVKIALYAPEVAKELAMRSSRDRIARGGIINAVLATIFVLPIWVGVLLTGLAVTLWIGFEKVSYSYELKAEQAIGEKLAWEAAKRSA